MQAKLEIFTLGGVRILRDGEPVTGLTTRKAEALLIYLASTRRAQPREVLADLFWDERTQSQALANLRGVLSNLHQVLGEYLTITRETACLNMNGPVWLDAAALEDCLSSLRRQGSLTATTTERAIQALELYRGEFLTGFSVYDCRGFEEWVVRERERLHRLVVEGLSDLVEFEIEQKDLQAGIEHATRLLELDPLLESAHRQLMRLYAMNGQRVAALGQYETCRKMLKAEMGVEPEQETSELYERIRSERLPAGSQLAAPAASPIPETPSHNLPLQLTSFIGREKEIESVKQLLSRSRLVTLTGSGGVGKTRLALQVGEDLQKEYPDGVWLVELAPLSDSQYVVPAIASVFHLQEQPNRPFIQVVLDFLQKKQLLLILDNCEHLIPACAEFAETLLKSASGIRILASSREALGVAGELPFHVPSLSLPKFEETLSREQLEQSEAVRLWIERARVPLPGFAITTENAPAIAQICCRLDGIPLALELAAARVKLLRVEQIAERLDDAFRLLTGGSRTALPRQQTLRATMDWSYQLLAEPERILLRRLAVFAGGWDLEAAEAICCDQDSIQPSSDTLQPCDIFDLLSGLVSKSMVSVEREQGKEARYRLLETIRQYARDKLLDSGEMKELRKRHLEYYMKWAEAAEKKLQGAEQASWYERLENNLENIRSALEWGLETNPQVTLRLVVALYLFWLNTHHIFEGVHWLVACLQKPENTARTVFRGRALYVLAELSFWSSESRPDPIRWAQECLDICLDMQDIFGQAIAHYFLGNIASIYSTDFPGARIHLEASLNLFRALGERWWEARTLMTMADLCLNIGEISAAKVHTAQCLNIYREIQDERGFACTLFRLGDILGEREGDLQKYRELYEQAITILKSLKLDGVISSAIPWLAFYSMFQGDFQRAHELYAQLGANNRQTGNEFSIIQLNFFLTQTDMFEGKYLQAARQFEQVLEQLSRQYPERKESQDNFALFLAYTLTHLNQLERAKKILRSLDISLFNYFFRLIFFQACGLAAFLEGDGPESARQYRESLERTLKIEYKIGELLALEGYAGALHLLGRHAEATQCLAAAYAFRKKIRAPGLPCDQPFHDRVRNGLLASLGEAAYTEAWVAGEKLPFDQAVEFALSIPTHEEISG